MTSKPTLLVPIAGRGQRFVDKGYVNPKPLIIAGGQHIIDYSFDSIDRTEYDIVFVVRKDHVHAFAIDEVLRKKYGADIKVVVSDEITQGSVCSCLLARNVINPDNPLVIFTLDVGFEPIFKLKDVPETSDGHILTFRANNPAYSYVLNDETGKAIQTAEKQVISQHAAAGIYYFKSAKLFFDNAEDMIGRGLTTNNEYYICPLYNLMISRGQVITSSEVEKMHIMGTPEELDFFVKKTRPTILDKPLAICADHSGFELKEECLQILETLSLRYIDFGTYSPKDCDYNDFVRQAAKHIQDGHSDFGIGFCRTGQGVNIAANKLKGIRAALIFDEYTAEHSRRHNCANFFSIPSKYVDGALLRRIIRDKLGASFDGGRHMTRVQKAEKNETL